jgi:ankyrin repeat protein
MRRTLLCAVSAIAMLWSGAVRADDEPPLATAIGKGDTAEVARLLDGGADPDTTWGGYSVLTWASGTGRLAIVKLLVERHATVDPKSDNGFTPLVAAASNKRPEIVAYLVAHGAKVNAQGPSGWTPLDDAEGNHDAKSAKILRDHGGVTGLPPLLGAANRGEVAKVQKLLASGADPSSHDASGGTALEIAANTGYLAIVKALVERKANVDAADNSGRTPLMEAAMNGHTEIVAYLIAHGATIDARNGDGQTALAIAVLGKHDDVAKLLRDHGATDAPPPAAAAPAPPTDADCADYRRFAEMGATGYASVVQGPAAPGSIDEAAHVKPANISLGGSECTVSEDDRTLACRWKDGAKDYATIASIAAQCSAGSKIDSEGGKTLIWYGGVPGKALVKIFVSDGDLVLVLFASLSG